MLDVKIPRKINTFIDYKNLINIYFISSHLINQETTIIFLAITNISKFSSKRSQQDSEIIVVLL